MPGLALTGVGGPYNPLFTPSGFSGLQVWLKADAGIASGAGNPVALWSDQSGLGNDATQATTASKPVLAASVQNGLPGLLYASPAYMTAVVAGGVPALSTTFLVAKLLSTSGNQYLLDGATTNSRALETASGVAWQMYPPVFSYSPAGVDTTAHVFRVLHNGTMQSQIAVDRVVNTGNSTSVSTTGLTLGRPGSTANYYLHGYIFELLSYGRALSAWECFAIETYLQKRWGTV